MTLTPEQLAIRAKGITATDISAILGANPYRKPIDVWLDKTGRSKPFAGNNATKWGNKLEDLVRVDYAERRSVWIEVPGTLIHPGCAWAMATPDGVCYPHASPRPTHGLEVKTHSFRIEHLYGTPGTDEVPLYELLQCAWNIHVTGLDVWDLVVFIDNRPRDYRIERDDELIGMAHEAAERFLVDNIRPDKMPEPDGSDRYDAWLSTAFPLDRLPAASIDSEPAVLADAEALRLARDEAARAGATIEVLVQRLKLRCGMHGGLQWLDNGKPLEIAYRKNADGVSVDYKRAWEDAVRCAQRGLADDAPLSALRHISTVGLAPYTSPKTGARPFVTPRAWSAKITKED